MPQLRLPYYYISFRADCQGDVMENVIYWLWLHSALSFRCNNIRRIGESFGDVERLYKADRTERKLSGVLTRTEESRLADLSLDKANRIYDRCRQLGYGVVTFGDEVYPESLRKINNPPAVLFYKGDFSLAASRGVAIVGTREASEVGKKSAYRFGYELAGEGLTIVSGGALGIDTQAHKGALSAGGNTIGVLGGGLNHKYLHQNAALRKEISENGLLLSEYPPDMEPNEFSFPLRNRIIAALGVCTLVVEAGMGSGSLITASRCVEQGKTVFAMPGSVDNPVALGTNWLLCNGARAAVSYKNIVEWLMFPNLKRPADADVLDEKEIMRARTADNEKKKKKKKEQRSKSENNKAAHGRPVKHEQLPYHTKVLPDINKEKTEREDPSEKKALLKLNEKQTENLPMKEKNHNVYKNVLTENALAVYDTISDAPFYVDFVVDAVNMTIDDAMSAITELELMDIVSKLPNGQYILKK